MDAKDKALSEKQEDQHLPNDHGALGERSYKEQDDPDLTGVKRADKTSEMEGLNEVKSAGSHGAFEGFENTEGNTFAGDTPGKEFDKKLENDQEENN